MEKYKSYALAYGARTLCHYGGNTSTSVWNWLKKHFTLYVENEPQIGPNRGGRDSFTI